jgi:hypothetical protein
VNDFGPGIAAAEKRTEFALMNVHIQDNLQAEWGENASLFDLCSATAPLYGHLRHRRTGPSEFTKTRRRRRKSPPKNFSSFEIAVLKKTAGARLFGLAYVMICCLFVSAMLLPFFFLWYFYPSQASEFLEPAMDPIVDAVVFVAIGPAATSHVLGWSIESVVDIGKWNGPIYVLTDQPESVRDIVATELKLESLNIVPLETGDKMSWSLHSINAKLVKCRLLDLVPEQLRSILYIDGDVIVGQPLESFWKNLERIWNSGGGTRPEVSLGMFEDCNAFTLGYCAGCDTWNSGVVSIVRGKSDDCLNSWCEKLAAMGGEDQAALDAVIAEGEHCQNIAAFERRYVRMMKDSFVFHGLISTKTFNHYTGLFRPQLLLPVHKTFYEKMLGRKLFDQKEPSETDDQVPPGYAVGRRLENNLGPTMEDMQDDSRSLRGR